MELNGVSVNISSYTSENINNEMVIYNEHSQKIIVLNETATIIWEKINESYIKRTNIFSADIAKMIMKAFDISDSEIDKIINDIDETIELFYQSELLTKTIG